MKWRWFVVVALPILLGGCHEYFPPCPFPGAVAPKDVCEYGLQVLEVNEVVKDQHIDVKAKIHGLVVEENRERRNWFRKILHDYQQEDYPFHTYVFHVEPKDRDALRALIGDTAHKDDLVCFESTPGSEVLHKVTDIKNLSKYYSDKIRCQTTY